MITVYHLLSQPPLAAVLHPSHHPTHLLQRTTQEQEEWNQKDPLLTDKFMTMIILLLLCLLLCLWLWLWFYFYCFIVLFLLLFFMNIFFITTINVYFWPIIFCMYDDWCEFCEIVCGYTNFQNKLMTNMSFKFLCQDLLGLLGLLGSLESFPMVFKCNLKI